MCVCVDNLRVLASPPSKLAPNSVVSFAIYVTCVTFLNMKVS